MTYEEIVRKLMEQLAATETVDHAQQLLDAVNDEASEQGDLVRAACECTKDELLRVFTEVTGRQFSEYVDPELKGYEYECFDVEVALRLNTMRGYKAFLVKPFEEKYELVMNAKGHVERRDYLNLFSTDEVYAIADKLGIARNGTEEWMRTVNHIRGSVERKLDELEQSAEVKKAVSVEVTEPVQVEVIDTPAIKAPKTRKGRKTMSKITVEQAVAAVQSATTAEEIQAVLEQCKKDQLHEVFLAVTEIKDSPCPKSWKKADIVLHCKWGIVAYKARNAFKAMDAETRAEYLTSEQFELDNNSVPVEETQEQPAVSEISSYVVGKQIAVLKGNAKAQQALLKDCGDEFLLAMHKVFSAPVRVTMEDPNELRKYMCRDVLKAIRTPDYAKFLLASVRADLKKDLHVKRAYLEGWEKFLAEYVPAMSREEKLQELRRQIRLICGDRYWIRVQLRNGIDKGRTAIYAQLTREGKELLRQYMELKHSQSKFAPVISLDYDSAFDEPAYIPDYQENLAALDDVPESRILDIQEVGIAVYEAMEEAYEVYIEAEDKYLTSHETDMAEKVKSDAAFRKYLTLLYEYRRCGMPKREEALNWVRKYCGESSWPVDRLIAKSFDFLETLCHKCGIHAAYFKGYCNRRDMAVMLLREAGIETRKSTGYEQDVELRKELQTELHKYWQKRHALRKAQRIFGAGSADAEALNGMWEQYQEEADFMLYEYKAVAMRLKKWRRYEADSRGISPAPVQEEKPIVESKVSEPEVQVVLASKPKATRVYRKKSSTPIKKSHAQTWKHYPQLIKKASRHIPSIKPLVKLGKSASTVRVKKF